ncbi:NepR family anti-sigma factor [Citreimonas sp.]|uniref:NepR family anti-sigma factor n=1 Tax=Citreimonas sp. TaxID=3036715 RepID=UPI0035C8452A
MKERDTDRTGRRHEADPINENLRRVYDGLIDDEVPDRFTDLLRKLREQDQKKDGNT